MSCGLTRRVLHGGRDDPESLGIFRQELENARFH